jgi:hypothetical protein
MRLVNAGFLGACSLFLGQWHGLMMAQSTRPGE